MNQQVIELLVNTDCQLVSIDKTDYSLILNIDDYISMDFLVDYDGKCYNPTISKYEIGSSANVIALDIPLDDAYTYNKALIPTIYKLVVEETYDNITLKNELFFYDNKIYYGKNNISPISGSSKEDFVNKNIASILENSELVSDYTKLEDYNASQTYLYIEKFASICFLRKCLIKLQKSILDDPRNCLDCNLSNSIRYKRDFLLASIYVLQSLICINNYSEIHRILMNLRTCSDICENSNDCGCGTIKY